MDDRGQVPTEKARNEDTRDSQGPKVHVAPSGTLYVKLDDLVPYFLPTEGEVRGYIKKMRANIERHDSRENGSASPAD
jgi:hypothetical protein